MMYTKYSDFLLLEEAKILKPGEDIADRYNTKSVPSKSIGKKKYRILVERPGNLSNYTINDDGTISCNNVTLLHKQIKNIPYFFKKVNGNFNISYNKITTLKGSPIELYGEYDCSDNQLKSLKYVTPNIKNYFNCSSNILTSLEYCPSFNEDGITFNCSYNNLTSLEGLTLSDTSKKISRFECADNQLTSFDFGPKEVGYYACSGNICRDISDYPLCIIHTNIISSIPHSREICEVVKSHKDEFRKVLHDKTLFHRLLVSYAPHLIEYYTSWVPFTKKSTRLLL